MRYYARALPPAGGTTGARAKLFNWFVRARDYYFSQPPLKFEAMTLGFALLFGLLIMPALIYVPGYYILKPYASGGLFSLYGDFYKGLFELRPSSWTVLAGPFIFLTLFRVFRLVLRKI